MDPLDFAVYRFLSPGGEARFWAGRRVLDPRVTPRDIAEKVGVSESGVRSRLRRLTERGFLRDRMVLPNPSLFGRQVFVARLLVKQPGEVDRILHDLELVDGVLFARDVLDEDERQIQAHFASEDLRSATRLAALLGRLLTGGTAPVPRPYFIPPCDRDLSRVDWRVLAAARKRPEASFARLAADVGLSVKTVARSFHRLIESKACWWTHGPASEEFPLALVRVELGDTTDANRIRKWLADEGFLWMPVAADGFGRDPREPGTVVAGLVPADLPTVLERFLRQLAAVDGVTKIRRTFALGSAMFPSWFSSQIARNVRDGQRA
jgi:DNA-binding Lrp family transcriptional regulator